MSVIAIVASDCVSSDTDVFFSPEKSKGMDESNKECLIITCPSGHLAEEQAFDNAMTAEHKSLPLDSYYHSDFP